MTEPELPQVGPWALDKLDRLGKYLRAYTTIMKNQDWCEGYVYVDAFAGAGQAVVRQDETTTASAEGALFDLGTEAREEPEAQEVLAGSPRVALDLPHPFSCYVFVEQDPARRAQLEALHEEYGESRTILIRSGDCNEYLTGRLLTEPNWAVWRGVAFLDPFGMQVPWSTIEGLAATGSIEVFINFPVGMAIQRLLKRSGEFSKSEREKLDIYFGDPGWFDLLYERSPGLFREEEVTKAENSGERLVKWYTERLKQTFGFVSSPHLVKNSRHGHLYYLLFAGPKETGAKIASHVLSAGERLK